MNSYRWDWQSHLWLMEMVSGNAREITPAKKVERAPEWSPDGKMMGFLSNRDGKTQVYTAHADGSEPTAVTSSKYGVSSYHWSPDGRTIAYLAKDDSAPPSDTGPQVADREGHLSRLWVTDLASAVTRSVDKKALRIDEFQWLNPSQILIVATDQPRVEQHNDAVYSVDVKDSTLTLLSRPPQPFRGLSVSPDAKQFAVRSTRTAGPDPRDLFVGTIGRDYLRDISAPPGRSVAEVKWHDQSAIWVRVVDGFHNRIWRLSQKGSPLPVDLPLSADSFDISRDGVETEMVLYPGEGHSPRNGSYNIDKFERILNWYDRFLKSPN